MQGPDDDAPSGSSPDDDAPYTVYGGGGGRRTPRRAPHDDARSEPGRADDRAGGGRRDEAPYTVYSAQRRLGRGRAAGAEPADPGYDEPPPGDRRERRRRRRSQRSLPKRVLRCGLTFVVGWIVLSLVLFVVSATIHQQTGPADDLLGGGGAPFTPTNVLVLGTDARPPGSKEPGAEGKGGASRTDTMMLMRTGGFANAQLSIPRDTLVELPPHGLQKINAAYAFDGTRGAVRAVESLTGVHVNHVAEIDFENFPGLVDAMGGIKYTAKTCLTSDVSGGAARPRAGVTVGKAKHTGGTSFRLKKGKTYSLNGTAALALARVRKNSCDAGQDDINRAQRQQQLIGAMKRRVLSPVGFLRLPLIAWKAPQAIKTDMSGFTLLGVAIGKFLPGGGSSSVLKPSSNGVAADGGQGLVVSPSEIERARRKFDK